jgi:hypothetical protein
MVNLIFFIKQALDALKISLRQGIDIDGLGRGLGAAYKG